MPLPLIPLAVSVAATPLIDKGIELAPKAFDQLKKRLSGHGGMDEAIASATQQLKDKQEGASAMSPDNTKPFGFMSKVFSDLETQTQQATGGQLPNNAGPQINHTNDVIVDMNAQSKRTNGPLIDVTGKSGAPEDVKRPTLNIGDDTPQSSNLLDKLKQHAPEIAGGTGLAAAAGATGLGDNNLGDSLHKGLDKLKDYGDNFFNKGDAMLKDTLGQAGRAMTSSDAPKPQGKSLSERADDFQRKFFHTQDMNIDEQPHGPINDLRASSEEKNFTTKNKSTPDEEVTHDDKARAQMAEDRRIEHDAAHGSSTPTSPAIGLAAAAGAADNDGASKDGASALPTTREGLVALIDSRIKKVLIDEHKYDQFDGPDASKKDAPEKNNSFGRAMSLNGKSIGGLDTPSGMHKDSQLSDQLSEMKQSWQTAESDRDRGDDGFAYS